MKVKKIASQILRVAKVFQKEAKNRFAILTLLYVFLGALDLVGIALIGIIGTVSISGVSSREPLAAVSFMLDLLGIKDFSLQMQVTVLGISALIIFFGKSIAAYRITRRINFYLSRRGADLSEYLLTRVVRMPLSEVRNRPMHEVMYAVTSGVSILVLGVVAPALALFSDLVLLIFIIVGLAIVDVLMSLFVIVIFALAGFALYKLMSSKARNLGMAKSQLITVNNIRIMELLRGYREILVRNTDANFVGGIGQKQRELARVEAGISTMPFLSKYFMESFFVFVVLSMSAIQFALKGAVEAFGVLALFLAASTRISPAVLRIQQSLISIKSSLASSEITIKIFEETSKQSLLDLESVKDEKRSLGFVGNVLIKGLSFSYPNSSQENLFDINLQINPGEFVALVGPSGAGKSTLFDCCLGIQQPQVGEIKISGLDPRTAFRSFPGCVAYVPQEVFILNATLRDNLLFGIRDDLYSDQDLLRALEGVNLSGGKSGINLDSQLTEFGNNLSGGQRQRIGIARALVTNPRLIFLDEATSSLDSVSENEINMTLQNLRQRVSIFMIAHRLSSVQSADKVVYMERGSILTVGTFEEVRGFVPNFDKQSRLLGL